MKELDTKEMDSEEQELYGMIRSKFNPKEMKRLAILMIIDAEKYHQEKLNKNIALGDVSKCDCSLLVACEICGDEKGLDGDFWKNKDVC